MGGHAKSAARWLSFYLATGPPLRRDQSGCRSAYCPPHFVHLSRAFKSKSFVVSPAPCAASSSNVIAP